MTIERRFSRQAFLERSENERLVACADLSLTSRLNEGTEFHAQVRALVEELRALGHDLWSYDEDDDFEIWGPDYQRPSGAGLVVTFRTNSVLVEWSDT